MQPMTCHHLLNIPITHFIKNIEMIPKLPDNRKFNVSSCDPKLYLHDKVYQKLSELGVLFSLIFSMTTGVDKGSIHIDLDATTLKPYWPSLNIVIDGQGVMRWFNPSTPSTILKSPNTGVFYKAWFNNYGEPIDEWNTGKVALVRTDIPHQAWNFDSETRRIVTIRWNNRKTWEETIEWFNRNFPEN